MMQQADAIYRRQRDDRRGPYQYTVLAARVVDGDTVDLLLDLGFRQYLEDRFRLADHFDAPEMRGVERPAGLAARNRLRELLQGATAAMVRTEQDHQDRAQRGKYGRYVARLYIWAETPRAGWVNVTDILRHEGHEKRKVSDAIPQQP